MESDQKLGSDTYTEGELLRLFIERLQPMDSDSRARLMRTLATYFELPWALRDDRPSIEPSARPVLTPSSFSSRGDISPKQFLVEKSPNTDIERVACLGYYLTHYRELPHFETPDIVALNTEAAQPRFANASWTLHNALKQGYLAQGSKGKKQLSAIGEQFVLALPDRDAAKSMMQKRASRRTRSPRSKKGKNSDPETASGPKKNG